MWKNKYAMHSALWTSDDSQFISLSEGSKEEINTETETHGKDLLISVWDAANGSRATSTLDADLGDHALNDYGAMSDTLAVAHLDNGTVRIYDIHLQTKVHEIALDEFLNESCFSPSGIFLACASLFACF